VDALTALGPAELRFLRSQQLSPAQGVSVRGPIPRHQYRVSANTAAELVW
jgi:hypothetical protein